MQKYTNKLLLFNKYNIYKLKDKLITIKFIKKTLLFIYILFL